MATNEDIKDIVSKIDYLESWMFDLGRAIVDNNTSIEMNKKILLSKKECLP